MSQSSQSEAKPNSSETADETETVETRYTCPVKDHGVGFTPAELEEHLATDHDYDDRMTALLRSAGTTYEH